MSDKHALMVFGIVGMLGGVGGAIWLGFFIKESLAAKFAAIIMVLGVLLFGMTLGLVIGIHYKAAKNEK